MVTRLLRCSGCKLLYRAPTDNQEELEEFYSQNYNEGFTTELPDVAVLENLLASNFKDTEKDYSAIIKLVVQLSQNTTGKFLDFGCSWGYGAYQFQTTGFNVTGYEIGRVRFEYAKKNLGIKVVSNLDSLSLDFDIVFSSHVLEHIPALEKTIGDIFSLLKKDGMFIAITPNGSLARKAATPHQFHKQWGLVHPLSLDLEFYQNRFKNYPYFISSADVPRNRIDKWDRKSQFVADGLSEGNLLIAVINQKI